MKKNRFLTFLFSFVPGCGLMYLGYMKRGLQIMLTFAAAGFIGAFFSSYGIGWFEGLFFLLLPVIWFYQIFDAMHTVARMQDQGIELPADDSFFLLDKAVRFSPAQNRTVAKVAAIVLILVGSLSLVLGILNNLWRLPGIDQQILNNIYNAVRYNLIPAVFSLILIIAGIKLLKGGKNASRDKEGDRL